MLNNLSINLRVLLLIIIPAIIFGIIGYYSHLHYIKNESNLKNTNESLNTIKAGSNLNSAIDKHYTYILDKLRNGRATWELSTKKAIDGESILFKSFADFNDSLPRDLLDSTVLNKLMEAEKELKFNHASMKKFLVNRTGTDKDWSVFAPYLVDSQYKYSQNLSNVIKTVDEIVLDDVNNNTSNMVGEAFSNSKTITVLILITSLLMFLIGFLIARSIKVAIKELNNVVTGFSEGDFDIRANVVGTDEIAKLSTAFNGLLDDRAVTLGKIDAEHQNLNLSVFSLLQAVADLSERDLTIRATVTEDATGPVADALNLLAEETSNTLKNVKSVAFEVNETSQKVNEHLMSVNKLAMKEQKGALETAEQMNSMLIRLDSIASSAAETNSMADTTSISTKRAHESVTDTLSDMSNIRTTVQETGKRIKQLGERSEEISHVIDIINTIAERTTVLALNASMQAVKAGDAGKGFAVIAEEIQRLAETSRESTNEISTLVNNIQQETNTTIATMDKTIVQVIDGSTKAEDAAIQMQTVLDTTNELVDAVDKIATASLDQVSISEDLKLKAEGILESTQVTGQELLSLTGLSRNMSEYAQQLVASVNVFTLEKKEEVASSNKAV